MTIGTRPSILAFACILLVAVSGTLAADTLVATGSTWKYLDDGTNQGTAWRASGFPDGAWASGPAELGYSDGDEATVVGYGGNASAKFITTYFRKTFNVANPAAYAGVTLRVLRDDGAVVYLNGVEVYRTNMPTGTVTYTTLASVALGGADETTYVQTALGPGALVAGTNTIAVEIHQANATSTDISFNLELTASTGASVTRGPYLQMGTPTSIVVKWRTDASTDGRVRYGTDSASLNLTADAAAFGTEHEIGLSGLAASTKYFYSVGSTTAVLASGSDQFFTTSPTASKPTRIWVIGDAGTGNASQLAVRDAYLAYTGARGTDLWLMLGDNAYQSGTDAEYQSTVFNVYGTAFKQAVSWPTIGNHDTAQSTNPPASLPYYSIFTLPTAGEAGGSASGTEDYYSFDYGNIHFVCLDSMTSDRAPGGAMATWLNSDLSATTKEWLIAYWHHPPYSKGSHDSDTDLQMSEMRQNLLPILENHGVDLVMTGHSHAYERTYLIDNHYGVSTTWDPATMLKGGGSGREDGTGKYQKGTDGLAPHEGAVYVVAGSSGQISGGTLDHPAMYVSFNRLGSMVLDVNGNRLDAKFIRETGAVDDYFTIVKAAPPNIPPTVLMSTPSSGATFTAPATISVTASASDSDGAVANVAFRANGSGIGSDATSPFGVTWSNVAAGSYTITAIATDNAGATTTSSPVSITVNPAPAVPAAPSNLAATALSPTQVKLTWADNSSNETGFLLERALNGGAFVLVATPAANVTNFTNAGLTANKNYSFRIRATNGAGNSAYSNTATVKTPRK